MPPATLLAFPARGNTATFLALAASIMLAALALIWAPYGFALTGLIEEWGVLGVFTQEGPLYFVTSETAFAAHRLRPLTLFPQALAYRLDPDSFLWWHLIQALSIGVKGLAVAYIVWWLHRERYLAFLAGLLTMLYPADTMQLAFRSAHINGSVALLLAAVAAILAAMRVTNPVRLLAVGGAMVCFVLSVWMYEAALFLAPLPLMLLWARSGRRNLFVLLAQHRFPVVGWLFACCFSTAYILWVIRQPALYQSAVSGTPGATLRVMLAHAPMLFTVAGYRLAFDGWYDALRMLFFEPVPRLYFALALLGIAVGSRAAYRHARDESGLEGGLPWVAVLRWTLVGAAAASLGYLPYLSSMSHLLITQRTYLFSTFGAVLALTGLLAGAARKQRLAVHTLAGVLLLLGLNAQWVQFGHYNALAARQKIILSGILAAVPELPPGKRLLILDQSGSTASTWMLKGELLGSALTYLYGQTTLPLVCMQPGLLWSSFSVTPTGQAGRCREQEESWEFGAGLPGPQIVAKRDLVTLTLNPEGVVARQDAASVAVPPANVPPADVPPAKAARWAQILGCWPAADCRATGGLAARADRVFFDFGHWWSLEDAQPGAGWRDAEWTVPAWKPRSVAWKNEEESSLWFALAPAARPYHLRVTLGVWAAQESHDALKLRLNGQALEYVWSDPTHADAPVAAAWLKDGMNELRMTAPLEPTQGVSIAVDSVRLLPDGGP